MTPKFKKIHIEILANMTLTSVLTILKKECCAFKIED